MLLILSLLMGYSFDQAVRLFGEASRPAMKFPELARGMTPLDGIFVPTFAAWYLVMTLLFPFVAIRAVGQDRQSGALKLVLQLPLGVPRLLLLKLFAVGVVWLLVLVPGVSAILIWLWLGGHVYWPELANLLLGHLLYALVTTAIAFFAASVAESLATAAIVTLTFTIGSWVLDFAGAGQIGWLAELASLSLTGVLGEFERGRFALSRAGGTIGLAATLLAVAAVWLPPGVRVAGKARESALLLLLGSLLLVGAGEARFYADMTEDRRNSFSPADEAALRQMQAPLTITMYLSPDDSRARELEANVLSKLRHIVPHAKVQYDMAQGARPFGASGDDRYGTIVYEYRGRRQESRSNSPREILPILHELAGVTVQSQPMPTYRGYPLVADSVPIEWWFYGILPGLFSVAWWMTRRRRAVMADGRRPRGKESAV
jgi:hypothetical protein